jgi:flagellar P-ring protein precursor FlgI
VRTLRAITVGFAALLFGSAACAYGEETTVRLKDLGRFLGWRQNALVGYGIVVGLSGSGDSQRNEIARIALKNALNRLGASVTADQIQSRNVAAVSVTAVLPPSAHAGDQLDATISSIGDAKSLVGGTLLMTPLAGPDHKMYALAQGHLVVGGYRFDTDGARQQRNYPTTGILPAGAVVESEVSAPITNEKGKLTFILNQADATTAERIKGSINAFLGREAAEVIDSDTIEIDPAISGHKLNSVVSSIQELAVTPGTAARVVINERTGTIVAGGDVRISSVVVAQGDLRVTINPDPVSMMAGIYLSDPYLLHRTAGGHDVLKDLTVIQPAADTIVRFPGSTAADLAEALTKAHVDTRTVIAIFQAVKAAGALHAEIIIQ